MTAAVTKLAPKPAAAFDAGRGCLHIVASSEVPDRDDEVVIPGTLRLDDYRRNPIVLGFHDLKSLPIAKCEAPDGTFTARLDPVTGDLVEDWYFAATPEGATFARLYQDRILRGASVGFKPDGMDALAPEDAERRYGVYKRLGVYTGGTVFETSAVPLPSCPAALARQWVDLDALGSAVARRSVGADRIPDMVAKSFAAYLPRRKTWAARILDHCRTGFPAAAGQFPRTPERGSPMSQPATATVTETAAAVVAKDAAATTDDAAGGSIADATAADPVEQVKAGLMASMAACLQKFGVGEMTWDDAKSMLGDLAKDFMKYNGGTEPDGDEGKAETEAGDLDADGGVESLEDEEEAQKAAFLELVRKAVRAEVEPIVSKVADLEATAEATVSVLEILRAGR